MKNFADFLDLTGKGRTLQCAYHGTHNLRLEGRILAESDSGLTVGVSLHHDDVASSKYDSARKSLDVWYQPPAPGTIGILLFRVEPFDVPKDIQEINVYDEGQVVK